MLCHEQSRQRLTGARGARLQVFALFFVCAFGSSLDVAAIQAESPEPLDFNHELQTVGARASPFCQLHLLRCAARTPSACRLLATYPLYSNRC